MNAKQIADELENIYWIQGDGKGKPFQQYANFVRQQQAEIEALKKEAALQRLSDFTQEADNEPVAIRYDFDGYGYQYMDSGSGSDWQTRVKGEFLYTHPAKTLTNEEIESAWFKVFKPESGIGKNITNGVYDFARAILKKAGEK